MKKTAYFARPVTRFNTPPDLLDIRLIQTMGYDVVDIASDKVQQAYAQDGMVIFELMVKVSDVLFFRAFPDGLIGAGVAKEIGWAESQGVPVFEIPTGVCIADRTLSVAQTRERLS